MKGKLIIPKAYILTVDSSDEIWYRECELKEGELADWSISTNWKSIRSGDPFLFLSQRKLRGIIGFGEILSRESPGTHYPHMVEVRFNKLIDHYKSPQLILSHIHLSEKFYRIRQSGVSIDLQTFYHVRDLFLKRLTMG